MSRPQSLTRLKLPEDYENLSDTEKAKAQVEFRLEEANLYYTAATGLGNDLHLSALRLPNRGLLQHLISQTGFPWDTDFVNLKVALVRIAQIWANLSSAPCPISFSPEEQENAFNEASERNESAELLSRAQQFMGIDLEGSTVPDNIDKKCYYY